MRLTGVVQRLERAVENAKRRLRDILLSGAFENQCSGQHEITRFSRAKRAVLGAGHLAQEICLRQLLPVDQDVVHVGLTTPLLQLGSETTFLY